MHYRIWILKYLLCLGFFTASLAATSQNKSQEDFAFISKCLARANEYASVLPDSAQYYSFLAERKAETIKNDSLLAQAWFITAKIYYLTSNYDASLLYQAKALSLARKVNDRALMAKAYNLHGAVLFNTGQYQEALAQYKNKLQINTEMKDTSAMLQGYYNAALVYNAMGQLKQYVEMVYKGLDLAERTHDTINLMVLNEGLGSAFNDLNDPRKGLYYLDKAYKLSLTKKQDYDQSGILIDIGNIYQTLEKHDSAIYYYHQAIKITGTNGDKKRHAVAILNEARSLVLLKRYEEALALGNKGISISEEINYVKGMTDAYTLKAEVLYELNRPAEALPLALKSVALASKIKLKPEEATASRLLSRIYSALGNTSGALSALRRSKELRDSIESNSELRMISGLELEYEKQKLGQQRKYEEELAAAELRKQKQIRNLIIITCVALLVLLGFILRSYLQKQKASRQISRQKKIIEEKNAAILEDINYSRHIQEAMLATPSQVKELFPESFVLFKPKDIVSGDFYFIEPITLAKAGRMAAIALADCTGHGVPGALMSITGYNMLKQSISEPNVNTSGEALDFLNNELYSFLRQSQKETHIRDGMDIAFCAINFDDSTLMFAGANNPLWIISSTPGKTDKFNNPLRIIAEKDGRFLYEIRADKQHIGFNENPKPFNTHTIYLSAGDLIYLFTDGYADQFGGPSGKKFKYKQLTGILLSVSHLPMQQQYEALNNAFESWKGSLEQVDDVSLVGIKY